MSENTYRKLYFDKQDQLLKVIKTATKNLKISSDLQKVCIALDEFQKEYEENTSDFMPGNKFYSSKLMTIVEQARVANKTLFLEINLEEKRTK